MPIHQDPLAILKKQRLEAQETVRRLDEAIRVLENIGPAISGTRHVSAAGRARIAAAQRKRWAKFRRATK